MKSKTALPDPESPLIPIGKPAYLKGMTDGKQSLQIFEQTALWQL